jgi:hypothetical protein
MFFACARRYNLCDVVHDEGKEPSPAHLAPFTSKATSHPALIPQEGAGSSRPRPPIPARAEWKGLLLPQNPAYSRSASKRQDRPVIPDANLGRRA